MDDSFTLKVKEGMDKNQLLEQIVLGDGSPYQYASPSMVYKFVKQQFPQWKFTFNFVRDFIESHVRQRQILAKPASRRFPRLPYRTWGYGFQVQMDLMFMRWNKKNILTCVELFSRQADAEICASKNAKNVQAAAERLLKRMKIQPVILQTDFGKEFHNRTFKTFCEKINATHLSINSEKKAAVVERFNRTLRTMYKIFKTMQPQKTPFQILKSIVSSYNRMPNSAIGNIPPARIGYHNAGVLLDSQMQTFKKQRKMAEKLIKPFQFKRGDYVRATVERESGTFMKSTDGLFSEEVFKVTKALVKPSDPHIRLYELEDLTGERIEGVFYEPQLRLARGFDPDKPVIDKVHSKRKRDAVVSVVDFPSKYRKIVSLKELPKTSNKRKKKNKRQK